MGVDVEGRADPLEDVAATVEEGLVTAGVRHGVVEAAVVVFPVPVAGVEVESPAAEVLGLQGVPGPAEGLVSHVLVHHPANVDGEEALLEDHALELGAAVGGGDRRGKGGDQEAAGGQQESFSSPTPSPCPSPCPAAALQQSQQARAHSAQQVEGSAEEKQVRQEEEPGGDEDQALDAVEEEQDQADKQEERAREGQQDRAEEDCGHTTQGWRTHR